MRLDEIDPTTGVLVWSITTAFTKGEKTPQTQIANTMPYFWQKWNRIMSASKT